MLSLKEGEKLNNLDLRIATKPIVKQGLPVFEEITNGLSISKLKTMVPDGGVEKVLMVLLSTINDFAKVVRPLEESHIVELAFDFAEMDDLKLEDFFAFVELFKKQHFFKIYDRIDSLIIHEAWQIYLNQRDDFFYNRHLDFKSRDQSEGVSSVFKEMRKLANILENQERFLQNKKDNE